MTPQTLIPILDLTRQYQAIRHELEPALLSAASSGAYILGKAVETFEQQVASYLGVRHAIGCANGSDALFLALRALNIGPGDEVITTPFTFIATSESIVRTGATPVLVDIEPDTFNINPALIEQAITPRTRAILPVHLYGLPANMQAIQAIAERHGLKVVEDCAQAIGATYQDKKVGGIGDVGCFSFFPSKNLGAMGDGGLVVTNDDTTAERLRMLRVHGSRVRYYHEEAGINSRLDAIQAAILSIKLTHLDAWNAYRQAISTRYTQLLQPYSALLTTPVITPSTTHVFHQYTVVLNNADNAERDALQQALQTAGVQTMVYYPVPLYRQQTHAALGYSPDAFPVSEKLAGKVLSLPMFPELTEAEQDKVVEILISTFPEIVSAAKTTANSAVLSTVGG